MWSSGMLYNSDQELMSKMHLFLSLIFGPYAVVLSMNCKDKREETDKTRRYGYAWKTTI